MPGEVRFADGRTDLVYTINDIPSAHTYHDRIGELEERIARVEMFINNDCREMAQRITANEQVLNGLAMNELQPPQYIQQLQEDMKWLKARCDDIQRIFNFDTMILNGISKQGE